MLKLTISVQFFSSARESEITALWQELAGNPLISAAHLTLEEDAN